MIGKMLRRRREKAARRLGNDARDNRDWKGAATHYRSYLELAPDDFAIRVQLGHVLAEYRDHAGADRAYAAAAELDPHDADLLLCWGHARKSAGDLDRALALYGASHAADGNDDARVAAGQVEAMIEQTRPKPEPEPEPVPDPVLEPAPDPEPEPEAPPASAGRVDQVDGLWITGSVTDGEEVEFVEHDRVIARARGAADGRFRTVLGIGHDALLHARRRSDGVPLDGSPFWIGPPSAPPPADPPAWAARIEVAKPFRMAKGDEVALFVAHSATGTLRPHVRPYLRALRDDGVRVLLVAATDRELNIRADVLDMVEGVLIRENIGYDFAAWAHALHLYPELYGASTLILANDSVVGPPSGESFVAMLDRVRGSTADLVALTESHEYRWHLQTYFLALKPRLLGSARLQRFFADVRSLADKDAVIRAYELEFARQMEQAGHDYELLFPSDVAMNPALHDWRALIGQGFPFLKLLLLRGAFPHADTEGWRDAVAGLGFDLRTIDAAIRSSEEQVPRDEHLPLSAHPVRWAGSVAGGGEPLKVAFYGPWNYDNGLGAASRGMIGALRRTGARLNLHPVKKPFHVHRPIAPPVDVRAFEGPADIAVVHLNPDSWFLLTEEQRAEIGRAHKRIGYWVWEMAHIPPAWRHDFSSVDRIWAPSRYCAELFARQDEAPVDVIPHCVPVLPPAASDRATTLAALGVAAGRRVILYVFDGSSYLVRKNPAALVRAFAASGLAERGWTLLLKTKHLMDRPDDGLAFRVLAEATAGTLLVDRALSPGEIAALTAAADVYASPHCSEGFGLTIAEAMAAGKPVVATDFGGSRDFLDDATGYPVKARAWQLAEDFGHYTMGGMWGRPDEPALVAALLRAAEDVERGDRTRADAARARIGAELSYEAVGARIADSFAATVGKRGGWPRIEPVRLDLAHGTPIEDADLGERVRAVALATDGSPAAMPGSLPGDREHWFAFAPAGSVVTPALGQIVLREAGRRPDAAIFYGDDVAGESAQAVDQIRLKPAFDATLLAAQDYVGAPLMVRADVFAALGGLRAEAGTAAGVDLLFRAHAAGHSIVRIPEVLLAHRGARVVARVEDYRRVLEEQPALAAFDVVSGRTADTLALARRFGADAPDVTLAIPTRCAMLPGGQASYVERLLAAIARVDWPMDRLRVIVGDDVAGEPEWARRDWPFALRRVETPRPPGERFNYAAKMNRLWRLADTEQIVFLNDDVVPRDGGWLAALQTFALDEGVGGVGARLLFEDGSLQHSGLVPHHDACAHAFLYRPRAEGSYQDWALVQREWSMVTGAVFATRRSLMEQVDGFDERFSLEYNDTDLCLRLRLLGYRIVSTPFAEMIHTEKASRGEAPPPGDDRALFLSLWRDWLDQDPSWHPLLRRDRLMPTPRVAEGAWFV